MRVTAQVTDKAGHSVTSAVDYSINPGLLLGMTSSPSSHNAMMTAFPGLRYTADFGNDGPDADTLPELPAWGSGKQANPGAAVFHYSWKDDPEQLDPWLSAAPEGTDPFFLCWYHEPHGDVDPAVYRANGAVVSSILETHPRRNLVLGHGPTVTRWHIVNDMADLNQWLYPGANLYCIDSYNDAMDRYRTPAEQYTRIRDFAAQNRLGWGVREWGKKRITSDTTGSGRVAAMRADVQWCAANGCLFMGWWNFGDTLPSSKIIGVEPEASAFNQLLTEYGG